MMNEQARVQELLMRKFCEFKVKNPSFSVRALATRLEMQPSATNEILKGQRRISRKMAEKIADKLLLDPSERADLLKDYPASLVKNKQLVQARDKMLEALKLNSDQFELISDWIHFAILSLVRVKNFNSDISWIAERLGVSDVEARKAILRLQYLNLIYIGDKGIITRTSQPVRTTDDIQDLSLQKMHANDLEIARGKLQTIPVEKRDYTNFTFPANPKTIKRAKEIIRKAQDELEKLMNDDDAVEVYRVCMYLFPLTKLEQDEAQ